MPTAPTHGYSGKPLFQKLGLKPGMRCLPLNAPAHYPDLVAGSENVTFLAEPGDADLVHLFCANRAALNADYEQAFGLCAEGGMVWISWPKKSSKLFEDLTEDMLREVLLPTGWVDVKVCAVDQDWSGLKFMRRKR
ncbi:MAG: hypothetical protein KI785_07955 [Devosiaceae bacterium]|nr:hypothetical protein [Devosiaceae bacterium MH13]